PALQLVLGRYDFTAQAVSRGDAVLDAVLAGGVALVLLDVTLAGSASLELCQRLTSQHLPVFLLSASPSDEQRQHGLQAGASAYLSLPCESDQLAEQVLVELGALAPATPADNPQQLGMQVNYHTMMAASPDSVLLLDLDDLRLLDVNRSARRLFGLTQAELLHRTLPQLMAPSQPDGSASATLLEQQIQQVLSGEVKVYEAAFQHVSGRQIACEMRMVAMVRPERRLLHVRMIDVSARKQAEIMRAGKNEVLEMIARGAPLNQTLVRLTRLIEAQSEGVICTIMLVTPDGLHLTSGAGPSMPSVFLDALEGIAIGPGVGSCGTAIHRREAVIVSDLMQDPLWAPYRHLAAPHGLRACWAMPIFRDQSHPLGSFAMYYKEERQPADAERQLINAAVHLAGIAISTTRREEELRRHRDHLEELVAARTAELQAAKEEAEHINEELSTALDNLSLTQDELVRRDKLAALGALVAGVAHELNTPIGNSLMLASTMSQRTSELRQGLAAGLRRSELEDYLARASEADAIVLRNLGRAAHLIDSFKRIAVDAGSSQRRQFQLDNQVAALLLPLQTAVTELSLTVVQDIPPGLTLDSYPGPLDQALSALFENSVLHGLAGREHGVITLRAWADDNGEIVLTITDNGAGIVSEHLDRIYDPFFTTRLGAGQSGLGLYITHNIVCGVLGGRIQVSSAAGQGTSFTLFLPPVAPR
ncbi:MAG: ATP-binding protein, partial [Sphingomonadaceae bacterium]